MSMFKSHLDQLGRLFDADLKQTLAGEEKYKGSWKKRGGLSACENVMRKIDRITEACRSHNWDVFKAIEADPTPEGLIDDVRDLRVYLALIEAEMLSRDIVTHRGKMSTPDPEVSACHPD